MDGWIDMDGWMALALVCAYCACWTYCTFSTCWTYLRRLCRLCILCILCILYILYILYILCILCILYWSDHNLPEVWKESQLKPRLVVYSPHSIISPSPEHSYTINRLYCEGSELLKICTNTRLRLLTACTTFFFCCRVCSVGDWHHPTTTLCTGKLVQCGIENIHKMRDSLTALVMACQPGEVWYLQQHCHYVVAHPVLLRVCLCRCNCATAKLNSTEMSCCFFAKRNAGFCFSLAILLLTYLQT